MRVFSSWVFGWYRRRGRGKTLDRAVRHAVGNGASVFVYYVDTLHEKEGGEHDELDGLTMSRVERTLSAVVLSLFETKGRVLGLHPLWGSDFAVYVSFSQKIREEEVLLLARLLQERLMVQLHRQATRRKVQGLCVRVGYAELSGEDIVKERYASVKNAAYMAKFGQSSQKYIQIARFQRILANEDIHMMFMPIVSLKDGQPLGWEALARGPENTPFHSPANLFAYAEETDAILRLEHICRKRALQSARYLNPEQKLFINLDPRAVDDPFLLRGGACELLQQRGLSPHNLVLEITERHAITNYASFRKIIEEYRKKGYLIAVDDAGAGYSSLESITEIYPDYIKLNMSLIRNIHLDTIKQALVETIVHFAEKVKCMLIAEGIETERELQTLIELGVPYGQGYYLGRPSPGMTQISGEAMNFICQIQDRRKKVPSVYHPYSLSVGDVLAKTVVVDKWTKVRHIHHLLEQNQRIDWLW